MTCKPSGCRLHPRTRPDPDTCSDPRHPWTPAQARRRGNPSSDPSPDPRPQVLGSLAPSPASDPSPGPSPSCRAPARALGPTAWARRGHLTVGIPPPALRGLRPLGGGGGGQAGRGGDGCAREGKAERGPRQRRGRGRGTGGQTHRRPPPQPLPARSRDREPAANQVPRAGAGRSGRPEARNQDFRSCAELPSRRPRSTGWRESQKASSASGQDGGRRGVVVGELRTGTATSRLSPKRRSQRPFRRLCEPGGHGAGAGNRRRCSALP